MHNVFRAASILDFSTLIMYHVCSAAIHAHLSVDTVMSSSEQVQKGEHLEINLFIRGYHVYVKVWDAVISEKLC